MDADRPIRSSRPASDLEDRDLAAVAGAIEFVARGEATRVTLGGLHDPELLGAEALPLARAAGVRLSLLRDLYTETLCLIVGPLAK